MTAPGKRFSFILKFSEELKKIDYRYIRRAKVKCSYPIFRGRKSPKTASGSEKRGKIFLHKINIMMEMGMLFTNKPWIFFIDG